MSVHFVTVNVIYLYTNFFFYKYLSIYKLVTPKVERVTLNSVIYDTLKFHLDVELS